MENYVSTLNIDLIQADAEEEVNDQSQIDQVDNLVKKQAQTMT